MAGEIGIRDHQDGLEKSKVKDLSERHGGQVLKGEITSSLEVVKNLGEYRMIYR